MAYSILILVCTLIHVGYGQLPGGLGGLGAAAQGAQLLGGGGPVDMHSVVQTCDAPEDHSCDNMPFSEIASSIAGGGLMSGAQNGILGGAAGGAASSLLGGLPGGRRRRGLFKNGGGLFHKAVPPPEAPQPNPVLPNPLANPLAQGAPNPIGNAQQMANLPGTSFFKDPNGMGPKLIQGKLSKCDENTKPGGKFDTLTSQLKSGDFASLTKANPLAGNAGDTCKEFMETDKQQCQMLKRQCCSFLKGGVKDPAQLSCAFKDIISTAGQVQAKNSACDTAQKLMSNPSNAGGALQEGGKGIITGALVNQVGNNLG